MKKIFILLAACSLLLISCNPCIECQGVSICKDNSVQYQDSSGNIISWEEYAEIIEAACPE